MTAYLDASVILPLYIVEIHSPASIRYVQGRGSDLVISDFAASEVASAMSRLVRAELMSEIGAGARLRELDFWRQHDAAPAEILPADVRVSDSFVRRFDLMLRAPDALHVAVAQRLGATLVTFDQRLATAARALGVEVETPA